jgi:hypothetical protein
VNVVSTAGYQSAVGSVSANAQIAPGPALPADSPSSGSGSIGSVSSVGMMSYDVAGLNLTIVTQDAGLPPGVQSEDTKDDKK